MEYRIDTHNLKNYARQQLPHVQETWFSSTIFEQENEIVNRQIRFIWTSSTLWTGRRILLDFYLRYVTGV